MYLVIGITRKNKQNMFLFIAEHIKDDSSNRWIGMMVNHTADPIEFKWIANENLMVRSTPSVPIRFLYQSVYYFDS